MDAVTRTKPDTSSRILQQKLKLLSDETGGFFLKLLVLWDLSEKELLKFSEENTFCKIVGSHFKRVVFVVVALFTWFLFVLKQEKQKKWNFVLQRS